MSRQRIVTILALVLVCAFCSPAFAAPIQLKAVSPLTPVTPQAVKPVTLQVVKPVTPQVVKPAIGSVIPVVAATRVTLVNPRTLKLEAGAPARQITLGGSGLDKASSAQLLRNNQPATGVSLQLLGGSPASRPLRIGALKNATPGTYTLRVMVGVTRIDVPPTTFSLQVTSTIKVVNPVSSAVAPAANNVATAGLAGKLQIQQPTLLRVLRPGTGQTLYRTVDTSIKWIPDPKIPGPVKLLLLTNGQSSKLIATVPDNGTYTWKVPFDLKDTPVHKIKVEKGTTKVVSAVGGLFATKRFDPFAKGPNTLDGQALSDILSGPGDGGSGSSGPSIDPSHLPADRQVASRVALPAVQMPASAGGLQQAPLQTSGRVAGLPAGSEEEGGLEEIHMGGGTFPRPGSPTLDDLLAGGSEGSAGTGTPKVLPTKTVQLASQAKMTGLKPAAQGSGVALAQAGLQGKVEVNNTGSLAVTSPMADDSWCVSESQNITWRSSGSTYKDLKILLLSNGSPVKTIVESTMVLDQSFAWNVSTAPGTYQVELVGRDGQGLTIKSQSGNFEIGTCGNVAAMAAAAAGTMSGGVGMPGGIAESAAKPQTVVPVSSTKVDLKMTGATLVGELKPGTIDISGSKLVKADGGLWLSHDGHVVFANSIEAEIVCPEGSSLTRANVSTIDSLKGPDMTFPSGSAADRQILFSAVPVVNDEILEQLCPDGGTDQLTWFNPNVQATWVCETDNTVDSKRQSIGNYPVTVNCDMREATASTLSFSGFKYECPEGFVIEGTNSRTYLPSDNNREGEKNCVRP